MALDVVHDLLDPDLEELAEEAVHPTAASTDPWRRHIAARRARRCRSAWAAPRSVRRIAFFVPAGQMPAPSRRNISGVPGSGEDRVP